MQKLEGAAPPGALRVVYCRWTQMDVIKGPGKAPALSAPEVMGDYPVKPWDEGGRGAT